MTVQTPTGRPIQDPRALRKTLWFALIVVGVFHCAVATAHGPSPSTCTPQDRSQSPNHFESDPAHDKDFVLLYQITGISKGGPVPVLEQLGLRLAKISYEGRFGMKKEPNTPRARTLDTMPPLPSTHIIQRAARMIEKEGPLIPGDYTVLDIEAWPIGLQVNDHFAIESMTRYLRVLDAVRTELPNRKFGNYGLPIHRARKASLQPPGSPLRETWARRNTLMQPLADSLDLFHPSLYTFEYEDIGQWEAYATAHIKESKRLARRGQPIIPFIWPQYHNRSKYSGVFLSGAFWRAQLDLLLREADGAFIWSNQSNLDSRSREWIRATEEFLCYAVSLGITVNANFD